MPVSQEQIDEQLKNVKRFEEFFVKKEIKFLPSVIREGEIIRALVSGMYEGSTWLVVATSQRVLFLDKSMFGGLKQMQIPLTSISSIQHKTGFLSGEVILTASTAAKMIEQIPKQGVSWFAEVLSELVRSVNSAPASVAPAASPASSGPEDRISKLERLAALKEKGILTEQEFQEQKAKILAG